MSDTFVFNVDYIKLSGASSATNYPNCMKNNYETGLSYYGLSLQAYLKASHPHLSDDDRFIRSRADEAAATYSKSIKDGLTHMEAEEKAIEALMRNLLFSVHDMLCDIFWNEFPDIIPQSEAEMYAIRVYPVVGQVLRRYTLTDEFAISPGYDKLYTELTGLISIWLEENEL